MKLYRTSWLKRIAAGTFTAMHLLLHFLSIRTWLFQPAAARPILRASSHPNRGGRIRWGELLGDPPIGSDQNPSTVSVHRTPGVTDRPLRPCKPISKVRL